jgi:hypothetical protein
LNYAQTELRRFRVDYVGRFLFCTAPLVEAQRVEAYEVRGESGTTYQIEIQFFWDHRPGDT